MTRLRLRHDESGVALVLALLGVVILAGLAVVFVSRATSETRAASFSQDYESAIHVVEDAADRRIAVIADDPEHVTVDRDGAPVVLDQEFANADEEAAWAVALTDRMRGSEAWVESQEGEAFAVRPCAQECDDANKYIPADVIYAVSSVPGFEAERSRVRVLKLQVEQASYIPEHAFLTEAAFEIGGGADIISPGCDTSTDEKAEQTCIADVHTNAAYKQSGAATASNIDGQVTTSGGGCGSSTVPKLGCEDGVEPYEVPEIDVRDYYDPEVETATDPGGQPVDWLDLCPDGTIRSGDPSGDDQPCTGEVQWDSAADDTTRYRGWRWRNGQWRGDSVQAGVFYVYHADAHIVGSDGDAHRTVTVLVERDPSAKDETGALSTQGNPTMQAAYPELLYAAEADVALHGRAEVGDCSEASPALSGLIYAGEQFATSGTVELSGAVLVHDGSAWHTLVTETNDGIGGTMCLEFDHELSLNLLGQWVVSFWNEL